MEENEKIKISFVGDIMCKRKQIEVVKQKGKYNFYPCFESMKEFFAKSDYVVGNLETPISDNNEDLTNQKFSFSTPAEFLIALKNVGFNLLSTANNHCLDRGKKGIVSTIDALDSCDLKHIGTYKSKQEREVFYENIDGMKCSFISYTYGTNANMNHNYLKKDDIYMVNLFRKQEKSVKKYHIFRRFKRKYLSKYIEDKFNYNRDKRFLESVKKDIRNAKEKSDFVFFCMHSGGQYNEIPENYTKKLMDFLIENGVDFVIGAHPHVVHSIKKYTNNRIGAYSLGNFYAMPYTNPMQKDEMPNYSIILNFYFTKKSKKLDKITYSIAKSETDENGITKVKLVKQLYEECRQEGKKRKLEEEALVIAQKFSGKMEKQLREEYQL